MEDTVTPPDNNRPASDDPVNQIRHEFEAIIGWCRSCDNPFAAFEEGLFVRLMRLARLLVQIFFVARRERLDLESHPCLPAGRCETAPIVGVTRKFRGRCRHVSAKSRTPERI